MHESRPRSIAHRDIKIENILLHNKKFKLADFGSASTDTLDFSAPTSDVDSIFEDFEKRTTFMYRPPEMIDKYKRFTVDTKVDIWVTLCLLILIDARMRSLHVVFRTAPIPGRLETGYSERTLLHASG
jgi:AP2-associated kinase